MRREFLELVDKDRQGFLQLDIAIARELGVPYPHTLSSFAYLQEKRGDLLGSIARPVIDWLFATKETDHCKNAYITAVEQYASILERSLSQYRKAKRK